jgi:hypothetical protein
MKINNWWVSKTRPTLLFQKSNSFSDGYTLRLHRRLREIAGFHVATLPGLEHTLAVQCGFWVNRAWQVLHDEAYV